MAAGPTYTPIATTTLGSSASNVTFSSISSAYTDLILVTEAKSDRSGVTYETVVVTLNTDTGSNYSFTRLYGDGTSATSDNSSNATSVFGSCGGNSSTLGDANCIYQFNNYSNTTTYKSVLVRANRTDATFLSVNLWRSTSAINSIKLTPAVGTNFLTGSTFTLYGIAAA